MTDDELSEEAKAFIETAEILAEPYNEKITALRTQLAAAYQESADLRAVIARTATDVKAYVSDRLADARRENAELRGEVEQYRDALADRDQELAAAEARLEAVRALHRSDGYARPTCVGCGREWPCPTEEAMQPAALSAAPQPEPEVVAARCQCLTPDGCAKGQRCMVGGGCWDDPRPPASDEPARCPTCGLSRDAHDGWDLRACRRYGHGPAASGTPDGQR